MMRLGVGKLSDLASPVQEKPGPPAPDTEETPEWP